MRRRLFVLLDRAILLLRSTWALDCVHYVFIHKMAVFFVKIGLALFLRVYFDNIFLRRPMIQISIVRVDILIFRNI